ncbi:extracellular metalloproteinase [Streptomyces sp. NBC_00075]|uniref:M36 family metallopeptidase n=1 Tax=Streptomyces sp. NBC_00075 TaxID=2975641 RepID=UPI00324EE98B
MTRTIDRRDTGYDHLASSAGAASFLDETDRVAAEVDHTLTAEPGKVNRFTGHLTELRVDGAPGFTDADIASIEAGGQPTEDTRDAGYLAKAKEYVASVSEAIGFAAGEPVEFEADPTVTRTSDGMRVVSLQQKHNGIEVWGMQPKVWLHPDGTVDRVVGDTVSVPTGVSARPAVPAEVALRVAAEKAAEPVTLQGPFGDSELPRLDISYGLGRLSVQSQADQPMTFAGGAFEEAIPARLVYLYMGGDIRLTWFFAFTRPNFTVQYHAFVEADERTADKDAPELLYFYDTNSHVVGGLVIRENPVDTPFGEVVAFPLSLDAYPVQVTPEVRPELPDGFPLAWTVADNGTLSTDGNNVRAVNGRNLQPFKVPVDAAGDAVFNADADTPEQLVTNIFYFCNYAHDFFMMLGFTEKNGNFQSVNRPGHGKGADAVLARAHPGAVPGTANMATRADGLAAVMNMGLVTGTGRHTANAFDVVVHEYVHGVTNRLVGGLFDANGLSEDQSISMGEGWSDYFALTIINFGREKEHVVVGDWVVARPGGIRQRPYDEDYPGTFGDIGKRRGQVEGAGNADLSYREEHDVGEIWCAALMELTRRVTAALDSKERGYRLTWQAVVDGLKLTPKNPSFLGARDAILRAFKGMEGGRLTSDEYEAVRRAAWEAFARYGMGFDAFCPNASFDGCQGGTQLPPPGHTD